MFKVGSGSLQYELVEGWEQLPAGYRHIDVAGGGDHTRAERLTHLHDRGTDAARAAIDKQRFARFQLGFAN